VINQKISDIGTTLSRFAIKTRNRIKYRNLSELINKNFGNAEKLLEYNQSRVTGPNPCVCFAPSRSLYFDIHGKATACCFNRVHILGKYPQNSIDEIVNGEKRQFLQNELARQNFMYGCQHCHKLIESGNFEGVEARQYDTLKHQEFIPSEIVFELDNVCNLECAMCHEEFSSSIAKAKGLKNIQHPYDKEFLKQLEQYIPNLKVAKFLGGEPFLINIYYEIWDLIFQYNPNCRINLQTNGTVFNDKVKSYLAKGNFYIGISIDSLQKDTYESIRKNAKFETVLSNIEEFIKISKKKNNYVNISVCPMQQNWKELPDLVEFCNKKKVFIYFNTVYTDGFAISQFEEEKLLEIVSFYKIAKFGKTGIIGKQNINFFHNLTNQIESWYNEKALKALPDKKRHSYSTEKLKKDLIAKISHNIEALAVFENIFSQFDKEFMISDNDLKNLQSTKPEDIILSIQNESIDELREKVNRFIETGRF
jgi:MoaA/NifB/PqqE/SkfB family radical SAM enzyme